MLKKSRIKWDTKNTTRGWCIYPQENHVYDEESELKQAEIEAIDEVSQTKIQQILHEKDDRLQNLIEHEQHEG